MNRTDTPHVDILALDHARSLARSLARELAEALELARIQARSLDLARAPDRELAFDLVRDLDRALDAARALASSLTLAHLAFAGFSARHLLRVRDNARALDRTLDPVRTQGRPRCRELRLDLAPVEDLLLQVQAGLTQAGKGSALRASRPAQWLTKAAIRLLPAADRPRYCEEWRAELWELAVQRVPRRRQTAHAVRIAAGVWATRRSILEGRRRTAGG